MNARRARSVPAVGRCSPCRCGSARIAVGPVGSCWTAMRTARSTSASGSLPGSRPHTGDPVRCADVFTAINTWCYVLKGRNSMGLASANAPVGTAAHPGDGRLHGARLGVVRSIWGLVVLIDVVVLAVGIPAYAAQLNTFCSDPTRVTCGPLQLVSAQQGALHQVGVSLGDYALYTLVIDAVTSLL